MENNIIIENKSNSSTSELNKLKHLADKKSNMSPNPALLGLAAGTLMAFYLLLLQISGKEQVIGLKFIKYLFLAGALGYGLFRYRKWNLTKTFFKNGIRIGFYTTMVAAITVVAFDLIVSIIAPEYSFNKFSLSVSSPADFFVISGAIFFEILVFGMIGTFIFLQYLKGSDKGNISG